VPQLQAGGAREEENRLQQAEKLIEERRYNEAIGILSEVMKRQPEKFDRAEELMQRIRKARQDYNQTYQELIEVLDVGPDEELDVERAYAIIQRLEELDADPNEAAVQAFAQARDAIIFAVNNQEFQQIMDEARELLAREEWGEAVELYLSGFSLHQELFEEEGYGELQIEQIDSQKQEVREIAGRFREQLSSLSNETDAAVTALRNTDAPLEDPRLQDALQRMRSMLDQWTGTAEAGGSMEELRQSLLTDEKADIPYLSTLRILIRGREQGEEPVGIAGAIERAIASHYQRLRSAARDSYRNSFTSGREAYYAEELGAVDQELSVAIDRAAAMKELNALWREHQNRAAELEVAVRTGPTIAQLRSSTLFADAVQLAARQYSRLPEIIRSAEAERERGLEANELEPIREARDVLREQQAQLAEMRTTVRSELTSLQESSGEVETAEAREELEQLRDELGRRVTNLRTLEARFLLRIAIISNEPHRRVLAEAEEEVKEARSYVEGVQETIEEGSEPITVQYPRRSEELVAQAREKLDTVQQEVQELLEELGEKREAMLERDPLEKARERSRTLLQKVSSLRQEAQEIAGRAADLNRQANLALNEGDLRLQEARAQLDQNNFERAREKLEQAGNAYSNSLSYREDPEVRRKIDQEIPDLADEIIFQQNQLIVRQVRDLINRGKELFFQEEFVQAEKVLQRAQSRWRQTHTEDDPEINIWLQRVQRALETTSGVRISTTDPLYPDMMQVLNLAQEDYRRGVELYEQGREQEAMERFSEAEKKIEYVKEPFPNNQEASVLYLRILQYTSPEDFNSIFSSRFSSAREKLDTVPEEAYRELKVLQEIKPDYQGMDEAIRQAEIATGIRQPPPDPEKLARARELYQQAQEIVEDDVRARFPVAVTYLNEALKLNPDYEDAIVLKDRIQAGRGGQVRVVLSSVDQQKLRRAEDLFIESRYYEASAIVDQLYQDPENRKNPKLIELKRRIESKL
jgi:hypothetical protein